MKVDVESLSRKIIKECMKIKSGERLIIKCGDPIFFYFCEELSKRTIEEEAYPIIVATSDEISLKALSKEEEYLVSSPEFFLSLMDKADAILSLTFSKDPSLWKDVPPEKLSASARGGNPVRNKVVERNKGRVTLRTASLLLPTEESAKYYGLNFEEYSALVWGGLDVDYSYLSNIGKKIASLVEGAEHIHITSTYGTDLHLSLKGRKAYIDDGVYSEEDMAEGVYMSNLPAGEVCAAPVEDSAEGVAVFKYNRMYGKVLKNLRVTFKKGKIVSVEGDEGADFYWSMLEKATGESKSIAELGIGLNPHINKIVGMLALDEKIAGTIHIATGDNRTMGGNQASSFHWDLVMTEPTVVVDGITIMDKGKYMV